MSVASRYDSKAVARAHDPATVDELLRAAGDFEATGRERLSLIEAAIVESGARNLDYGDRDSLGVLQQRAGWGTVAERMDPYASAKKFLAEARRVRRRRPWLAAGPLAQAVQRSAYPLRYAQAYRAARHLLALAEKRRES